MFARPGRYISNGLACIGVIWIVCFVAVLRDDFHSAAIWTGAQETGASGILHVAISIPDATPLKPSLRTLGGKITSANVSDTKNVSPIGARITGTDTGTAVGKQEGEATLENGLNNNAPRNVDTGSTTTANTVKLAARSDAGINTHHFLRWPPVTVNGTIPLSDGFDQMPLTNITVPRFWEPPINEDLNKVGSKVNGHETIFLMIASYRDFQCRETITSAFNKADHPERLFVGAVDQLVPGDIGCLDIDIPCSTDPNQAICKYRDQIAVFKMDAEYATGPVTARHIGDRMYRGEYFVMQMDAHCLFVRHWDTKIVDQWKSTKNEMAVLR
jgi:Glycosyltransferase (GlcNAc)